MKDYYLIALDSVTWYNGLAETIFKWYFLTSDDDYSILCPNKYGDDRLGNWDVEQLQVFWMIAVEMFGEYGMSPRYGWIMLEKEAEFKKWVLDITWTWRGSDQYNGPEEFRVDEDVEVAPWVSM